MGEIPEDVERMYAEAAERMHEANERLKEHTAHRRAVMDHLDTVAREMPERAMSGTKAIVEGPGTREEKQARLQVLLLDTLREMQEDQQQDPAYREAAALLAERLATQWTHASKGGNDG